jgi:eukaryotic-like serine/threonine-protein kinase
LKNRSTQTAAYYVEDLGGAQLEMVAIPGGTFQMGSPASEAGRYEQEGPQHQVKVRGFYMSKFEVTQKQYQAIMGTNPSEVKGDDLPAQASWNNAFEFCRKLSAKTGREYRLPTEAEWEYAARAGTTTPFAFGETITPEIVNFNGDDPYGNAAKGAYRQKETPVGSTGAANGFGLYDMHGNMWEWCLDYYHSSYGGLVSGAPTDGSAWLSGGDANLRIMRGGSWGNGASDCRSAARYRSDANNSGRGAGMRIVAVAR